MITDFSKMHSIEKAKKHADWLPNNIFAIIAGSTGCGKTNLMLNFLLKGWLEYYDVIIYTTTATQDAYKYLKEFYGELKRKNKLCHNIITFYNDDDKIIKPSELDESKTHIMIFDDVMTEKQKVITDYFTKGRHNNVNVFYLCQSIYKLKKHGIRQNANIFILFHQDDKTLKYFHETHCSADMSLEEFKKFCYDAWSIKHGFVVINIWDESECGRYIQNYKTIYIPEKYVKIYEIINKN